MDKEMLYALLKGKSGQPSSGSSIVLKGKDNDKFSTLSVYGEVPKQLHLEHSYLI